MLSTSWDVIPRLMAVAWTTPFIEYRETLLGKAAADKSSKNVSVRVPALRDRRMA